MKKRIFYATLLGAVIAFIWGFVSWALLPWHKPLTFKNSTEMVDAILENTSEHGMYMLPSPGKDGMPDAEAIEEGPFVYAVVRPKKLPGSWSQYKPMIMSYVVNLILAFIIALLMQNRSHYRSKALVGFVLGLFAGITASLPLNIWMELPITETLARFFDPLIAWTIAGLAMAAIVKKPKRRIFV